ncbi:MAG: hypothetical protein JST66_09465 [Bacteroidetes bacterium]|nr:hypothetical protein [Bacteroidota bacterium]
MPRWPNAGFRWTPWAVGLTAVLWCAWWTAGSWRFHAAYAAEDWHADLRADAAGYYVYLPAFFHWDLRADAVGDATLARTGNGFTLDREHDVVLTKYTCGTALLQLPFYLIAEAITGWGTTDGFSDTHRRCMELCAVFYWSLGSLLLALALQRLMPAAPWVAPVVLAAIGFGSNVFFYAFRMPGFSHIHSFFTVCLALYALATGVLPGERNVQRWLFPLACALIVLIRPVDVVAVLGMHAWILLERRTLLRSPAFWGRQLLCIALVWAPQLIYWWHVHGRLVVYSYGDEGFNWWSPELVKFLFAPRNGWLPYAPVLLMLPFGVRAMWKDMRPRALLVLGTLAAIVYVCSAWWVWYFGCSYGSRPMVQYMPFVAVPLWAFLCRNDERAVRLRYASLPLLFLLAFVNYRAMLQYDWCFFSTETWDWDHYALNIVRAFLGDH